ncbi:DMT family transporter [Paenibacillus sp. SI8]|uniref:DMT family transporter n=1 Tax=unclassified Paenibacillus TaxID=185978 RepID=UPI0034670808
MEHQSSTKAYISVILYTIIIGLSFLFVKMAMTVADPIQTLAHRFTIGFAVTLIPISMKWVRLKVRPKDLLKILPLALLYPAIFFATQAYGLQNATSSEGGIILATVPIFTLLFAAYVLKERSSLSQKLFMLLSVAGVVYIFAMKGIDVQQSHMAGALLLLLSAISMAGYNVLGKRLVSQFPLMDITFVMQGFAFIFFNAVSVIQQQSAGTLTLSHYFEPFASPVFVGSILYLSILSSIVSSLLSNYTLSKMNASRVSVFTHLSTLVTVLAGVLFLDEKLFYFHIIGGILVIVGIIGTNYSKNRARQLPPSIKNLDQ